MTKLSEPFPAIGVTRGVKRAALVVAVAAIFTAGGLLYRHLRARPAISVTTVVLTCKAHPSSTLTSWVEGYPVMAVTPRPFLTKSGAMAISYGSFYDSALLGNRKLSDGVRLVSGTVPGSKVDTNSPRLTLRLQGRTKMILHGQITCSQRAGLGPGMVIDAAASS